MAYIDQPRRPSARSLAGVILVHTALAIVLVTGLQQSGLIQIDPGPLIGINLPKSPPPPKPPETPPEAADPKTRIPTAPLPPIPIPRDTHTDTFPPIPDPIPDPRPRPDPQPTARPTSSFAPVGANPRNDPGGWLGTNDYRSSWIRREMVGTARFRLEIAANGRVTDCRITGSTGHSELDAATCDLISKRARFEPARGGEGQPVAGSYSSSVRWQLPE